MPQNLGSLARTLSVQYYRDALPAHDQFHAKRVHDLAVRLANDSEWTVDRNVLSAAAWFHDIGRPRERRGEIDHHGEWAAVEVDDRLGDCDVETERLEAIKHCVRSHSIRSRSPEPETPEAKLLFDADKLDATGAVGLVRLSCIVGERSGRAGEKFAVIDDSSAPGVESVDVPDIALLREWATERLGTLYTSPGRRLGESRLHFMDEFFERFDSETGIPAER